MLDDGRYRKVHETRRPFVVLSGSRYADDQDWRVVTGCPISKSTTYRTDLCVKLAAGEANMPQKCWIRVPALQTIPKTALGDHTGTLSTAELELVQARVLELLGLIAG